MINIENTNIMSSNFIKYLTMEEKQWSSENFDHNISQLILDVKSTYMLR